MKYQKLDGRNEISVMFWKFVCSSCIGCRQAVSSMQPDRSSWRHVHWTWCVDAVRRTSAQSTLPNEALDAIHTSGTRNVMLISATVQKLQQCKCSGCNLPPPLPAVAFLTRPNSVAGLPANRPVNINVVQLSKVYSLFIPISLGWHKDCL